MARVLVEQRLVKLIHNWAIKSAGDGLDEVVDEVGDWSDLLQWDTGQIWDESLDELGSEASSASSGGILEVGEVHGTTSKVSERYSGVCVDAVRVSTKPEGVWIGSKLGAEIHEDVCTCVLVGVRTLIPVVWDGLLTPDPLELVWCITNNSEELLEHGAIQVSTRLLGSVVGHEVDDKVVCGWRDKRGREWTSEVVWVRRDGFVGLGSEVLCKGVQSVTVGAVGGSVCLPESINVQTVRVSVVDVGIVTTDRSIALVGVVGPRNTLGLSQNAIGKGIAWGRTCKNVSTAHGKVKTIRYIPPMDQVPKTGSPAKIIAYAARNPPRTGAMPYKASRPVIVSSMVVTPLRDRYPWFAAAFKPGQGPLI